MTNHPKFLELKKGTMSSAKDRMNAIPFVKMHGTGNDFVVIDALKRPLSVPPGLARRICDRRFGVGADQILILQPSRKADFRMRILNADGSEVEMCGNGIRCLARFVRNRGYARSNEMSFETLAGIIRPEVRQNDVRVDMGLPVLDAEKIPTRAKGRVIEKPLAFLKINGRNRLIRDLSFTCVSMGNPHAVVFVSQLDNVPVETWGPAVENHPFFPKRTNVEFVQVTSPVSARVKVWERGAGLTMACGTGASAVAVAAVLTGRMRRSMTLSLPGGDLGVEWAIGDHVFLSGPAEFVYEGAYFVKRASS